MACTSESNDRPLASEKKTKTTVTDSNKTDASGLQEPKNVTRKAAKINTRMTPTVCNQSKRKRLIEEQSDQDVAPACVPKKSKDAQVNRESVTSTKHEAPTISMTTRSTAPTSTGAVSRPTTPAAKVRSLASKTTATAAAKARSLMSTTTLLPSHIPGPVAKAAATPASVARTTGKTATSAAKKIQVSKVSDEDEQALVKAFAGKRNSTSKLTPVVSKKKDKAVAFEASEDSGPEGADGDDGGENDDRDDGVQMVVHKENTTVRGTARKRKAPSKAPIAKQSIPKSYADCNEADKALIDMRDAGKDWETIAAKYGEISGLHTDCKSTLPNRYNRMKTNFVTINDEDAIVLFQAKIEVDKQMANELWERVAEKVEEMGGMPYTADALFRNWKRLCLAGDPVAVKAKEGQITTKGADVEEDRDGER